MRLDIIADAAFAGFHLDRRLLFCLLLRASSLDKEVGVRVITRFLCHGHPFVLFEVNLIAVDALRAGHEILEFAYIGIYDLEPDWSGFVFLGRRFDVCCETLQIFHHASV